MPQTLQLIGTQPNQVPRNRDLGGYAFVSPDQFVARLSASADPAQVGSMVFQLTNNTTLLVKVRGSDGVVRSATLSLT
jgi:hypothetical protein